MSFERGVFRTNCDHFLAQKKIQQYYRITAMDYDLHKFEMRTQIMYRIAMRNAKRGDILLGRASAVYSS